MSAEISENIRGMESERSIEWHPNPHQDPDVAVAAFDRLQAFLDKEARSLLNETRASNNRAAAHGATSLNEGVVGIAGTHPLVPRPLAMAISASDLYIHAGHPFRYQEDLDTRSLIVPSEALSLVHRIFKEQGFFDRPIAGYNHLAGTQHTRSDGTPDTQKNRIMAHLHRFVAGQLLDESLAILFVDPEYAIPMKQANMGLSVTRPSVTNIVGLNFTAHGGVNTLYSGRFETSTLTREQLATQKANPLTKFALAKIRPDLYEEPAIFDQLGVDMEALTLEKIDVRERATEIVSKFTPRAVMARLAHGRNPGPEVALQLSSTFLVLDGALYLMINPEKNPKIVWLPINQKS